MTHADRVREAEPKRDFEWFARLWLEGKIKELRTQETATRKAYTQGYMLRVATLLADCHAEAASVYERALADLDAGRRRDRT